MPRWLHKDVVGRDVRELSGNGVDLIGAVSQRYALRRRRYDAIKVRCRERSPIAAAPAGAVRRDSGQRRVPLPPQDGYVDV